MLGQETSPPSAPAPPPPPAATNATTSAPPAQPQPPTGIAPRDPVPATEFRVCTWNIRNFGVTDQLSGGRRFRGMKPEEEVAAICAMVRAMRPDILAVQEVVSADNDLYLQMLQRRLREAGVDYPHITTARGGDTRIQSAILSRVPFVRVAHRTDDTYEVLRRTAFPQDAALAPRPATPGTGAAPRPGQAAVAPDTESSPVAPEGVKPTIALGQGAPGTNGPSAAPGASGSTAQSYGGAPSGTTTAVLLVNRAILHVEVEPLPGRRMHLLVAHFKSRRAAPLYDDPATGLKGDDVMRRGEAAILRRAMLAAAGPDESQPVLAMGDLNDSPTSMAVRAVVGPRPARGVEPGWRLLPLRDYLGDTWTAMYASTDTYNRHDYMVANRAALALWDAGASHLYRHRDGDPRELHTMAASDHRPLIAVFRLTPASANAAPAPAP